MSEQDQPQVSSSSDVSISKKDQTLISDLGTDTSDLPPWAKPEGENTTGLQIFNSLTRSNEDFIPIATDNRHVNWYMCGPTVYSHSHLGHARTYLSFDIIRRIMRDYFNYDVFLTMNITDIDDKIILSANEQGISFEELSQRFEKDYFEDMKVLGIEAPDCITRVSEYVPEIIEYISKIIDNGYAYESNGSVYFDTERYGKAHNYPKLVPSAFGNSELLQEGEGKLADSVNNDKKTQSDFALWKKAKEGEPFWESPWGEGRPGWHIECSAMASNIIKETIDIHSGGIDLTFPHHDNELAQAEAFYESQQWINYFMHSGHLHIQGRKMSKSLKNFITIKEALQDYSARQIRILFLQHKYNASIDYSTDALNTARDIEKLFLDFFANVKIEVRNGSNTSEKWTDADKELKETFENTKAEIHGHLQNNFNTPKVMYALQGLVRVTNLYLKDNDNVRSIILVNIAKYVTRLFDVFGLNANDPIGFNSEEAAVEEVVGPILDVFANFRDGVRKMALSNSLEKGEVLTMCDDVRDNELPQTGVKLEDRDGGVWKLMDKEVLLKQMAEEREQAEAKAKAKEEAKAKAAEAAAEKERKSKIPPSELWAGSEEYSQFDEDGIPTHDASGEELKKSQRKKLMKAYKAQDKLHQKWLAKQGE